MKHATLVASFCVAAMVGSAGMASAQAVQLSIRDGRVTLKAEQASVREILAEWERLGQVKVVGVDRLAAGQPLTLTLTDLPERQALDIVLRTVPGFLAVDRATPVASASRYDRLVLLPRVTAPAVASAAPASAPARTPAPAQLAPAADPAATVGPEAVDAAQQVADADAEEPPMPGAPVINPYPGANVGGPGGNAAALGGGTAVGVQPPETQFDYANPQRYFDQMRQQQQQQQRTGTAPTGQQPALFPGSYTAGQPPGAAPPQGPTGTPMAPPGTLGRPGMAPTPAQPAAPSGQFFNPYNLPPGYVPPTGTAPPPANTVEPDRSKYTNPYAPPKPPE